MGEVMEWKLYKDQPFPSDEEQLENFKRCVSHDYIGTVKVEWRGKTKVVTAPLTLLFSTSKQSYYWEVTGGEPVVPIAWCEMPHPLVACTNTSTAENKPIDGYKQFPMHENVVTRIFDCETGVLIYSSDGGLVAIPSNQLGVGI